MNVCQYCKKEFVWVNGKGRFCSLNCYHQSLKTLDQYRVGKICKFCGNEYTSKLIGIKSIQSQIYCSKKCRRTHQGILQKTGFYKNCIQCNKSFYVKKCNSVYRFCCNKCSFEYKKGKPNPKASESIAKGIASGRINPKRNFYKQGWYTTKNGNKEWYGSSYELKRMIQLDNMGVKWTKNHGIRIPYVDGMGVKRNYVPDFLVNDRIIEEVKPKSVINTNFNNCKIKIPYAEKYCSDNGLEYKIITEKELNA